MGLSIVAKKTNGRLSRGYFTLHFTTRNLALLYCGMPEYLDIENTVSSISFFMHPYIGDKKIDSAKLKFFFYALQVAGVEFPNIMLHSDCDGKYTKNGKLDLRGHLMTGNSKNLLLELEKLISEETFKSIKYEKALSYTLEFYNLVKEEINNGDGIILFR